MKYTINELANSKGVSPLVREALLQMEAAIKQALAAPVQEPTGMLHIDRLDKWLDASLKERKAQRQWVGLTDDEMWQEWNARGDDEMNQQAAIAFARAVEAKLKERNV